MHILICIRCGQSFYLSTFDRKSSLYASFFRAKSNNDIVNEKNDFKLNGKHRRIIPLKYIHNLCGKNPFTFDIKNYFVNDSLHYKKMKKGAPKRL